MKFKILSIILALLILPGFVFAGNLNELGLEYTYNQTPDNDSNWIQAQGDFENGFTVYLDQNKGTDWVSFRLIGNYTGDVLKFTHPEYQLDDSGNPYGLNVDSDVVFWITENNGIEDRFCKFTSECTDNPENYLRMRADLNTPGVYVDYGETTFEEIDSNKEAIVNIHKLTDKPEEETVTTHRGGGINLRKRAFEKYGKEIALQVFDLLKEYEDAEFETQLFYWENQNRLDFVKKTGKNTWMTIQKFNLETKEVITYG